jgi:type I restriction enzyme S subunit
MELKPGYMQTEVGVIPEDWSCKKLSDLVAYTNGKAHENSITDHGRYVVVNSKFISTEGEVRKYSDQCFCEAEIGDVLMVMSDVPNGSAIAKCFLVDQDRIYTVNQRICILRPRQIDKRLLFYKIDRNPYYLAFDDGAKQTNLRKNDVLSCIFAIPNSEIEQREIAVALSDADTLIETLEQLLAKKRDIKQGTMQELLTGKKRLPGFSGEWETKRLGDIATIKDGTHQTPKYVDIGVPFYSVEHVTSGDFHDTKYISAEEHRFLTKTFKIEKGDILMTRIGSIGDCKHIDWDVDASFYVSLALLKIHKGNSASYIAHYSKTTAFKKEVELHSLQSAIPKKINLGPISDIRIELPPLDEQIVLAAIFSEMDDEIVTLLSKLTKARQIKQGMMQELLTGRIRLV